MAHDRYPDQQIEHVHQFIREEIEGGRGAEVISRRVVDRTGVNKAGTNDGNNSGYYT